MTGALDQSDQQHCQSSDQWTVLLSAMPLLAVLMHALFVMVTAVVVVVASAVVVPLLLQVLLVVGGELEAV